jgi:DNA-binding NtrC family response regulator
MHARLTIQSGRGAPPCYDLPADQPVSLGRNHENTIVLYDEHVSRFHATIFQEGGRWFIRDLKTRNGTRVNGALIDSPTVLEGDPEIAIGDIRLRFTAESADQPEVTPTQAADVTRVPAAGAVSDRDPTALQRDELDALYVFMAASVEEADPRALVERALDTVLAQTRASLAGFLSLDPDEPLPRMVRPQLAKVDVPLSRQLTQRVQRDARPVWLKTQTVEGSDGENDSLVAFTDALCVPLRAEGAPLGALHVYRAGACFTERDLHFCVVLAGHLAGCLGLLRAQRRLQAENSRLRGHAVADELVGDSVAMRQLRQLITRAAARPATVLIQGESGVGKELVARALHLQSPRRNGPLVAVNCAAIAPSLLESELFGYRKSAFTGADRDYPGLFEQADEGTLFLDEVGELSPECQAKLLRAIESKSFRPVGATAEVHVDVRIIAASNRDLDREARAGRFREDLLFRLRVIPMAVPPLRDRQDDVSPLVEFFLDKLALEWHRRVRLTEAALARLRVYSWPGNVRQLRTVLESAVALSEKDVLDADDLRLSPEVSAPVPPSLQLDELEAWAVRQALRRTEGNVTQAARVLGIVRDTLTSKMKKLGINRNCLD